MKINRTLVGLIACAALTAFAGSSIVACGGEEKPAVSPTSTLADGGAPAVAATGSTPNSTATPEARADVNDAAKPDYARGWQAWSAGDLATAASAFQSAASKDPAAASPVYAQGVVKERQGDVAGAQQLYKQAYTAVPTYDLAMAAYAQSLAANGHLSDADSFLTDKHTKYPNSTRITVSLADVKSQEKDSGSAQELAQAALRIDPNFTPAMVVIARDNYRTRRMELARYALTAILDGFGDASPPRDKDNAEAHVLRGLINRESGLRAKALDDFSAAYAKRPDLVEGAIQLGVMRLEAGNVTDAQPVLESAVHFAPKSALAHLNLGDCYRLAGRPGDARREFDSALSLDSSLAAVHYDLGLLYLFSPSIPGTSADDQVATAIKELDTYRSMRGASNGNKSAGAGDDADDLYNRAKSKQAEMKQAAAVPAAAAAPAAGATGDAGAASTNAGGK